MSRLIDADKLIEDMRDKWDMQDLYLPIHFKELLIDEQPTAFDVDKVEKELRSLKQYDNEYCSYYNHSMYMMTDFQNETVNRTIDKVLEIVKRGVIND